MMKKLLKKLVFDLPTLSEHTIVPLKMLTIWYERVGRYYGAAPIGLQASEEEKRLTMQLFTSIFDALAKRVSRCLRVFFFKLKIKFYLIIYYSYIRHTIQSCLVMHFHVYQQLVVHYHRIMHIQKQTLVGLITN